MARFEGTITSWDDERGFGFIKPTLGGQDIFLHIKACQGLRQRPKLGLRLSFEVELGPQGKKRATNPALIQADTAIQHRIQRMRNRPAQWGMASLFILPLFGLVLMLAYMFGNPPRWLLWLYMGLSALTFFAYALDKSAAQSGAWRTSESTLHVLALAGGWPGALLAQQILRHKSAKQAFRSVFWFTVGLNLAGLLFIASPYARRLLEA
ncbi:DUF1294 domain-containing protein [Massilia sp. W12]|uniref:DUF1294 domain-containing protein n=1 Tax=Massilia sp. W12 TaxID=3126507 RepID=UPI0030D2C653